jgi:hypothetical protein
MKGKTMKVSAMLFSLLIACQAMPVAMHAATAQPGAMPSVDMGEVQRAQFADQFGPERLRTEYNNVVSRSSQFLGKRQAVTYDFVVDINMALAGGNSMKNQTRSSYAYDKDGRMRFVSSIAGLERIIIVDPTTQAAYVVCPERKEVLRMTGAALVSPPDTAAPKMPEADKSGTRTDLGDKTIAGVRAHGVRIEKTIPAGARGNDKPISSCKSKTSSSATSRHPRLPCRKLMRSAISLWPGTKRNKASARQDCMNDHSMAA